MSRRQSLDRPGILSPPGPFLTPSPSPSVSASPRLQPSPSLSPFSQDVLLVASGNTITNTSQDNDRKAATPGRRQSIHQFTNGSPNAGTVVFQPSPSQSPAAATTVIGVTAGSLVTAGGAILHSTGNDLNTTLVGSNNIQLNKKGIKRLTQHQQLQQQHSQQPHLHPQQQHQLSHQIFSTNGAAPNSITLAGGYGQSNATTAINTPTSLASANVASSPKGQAKKVANHIGISSSTPATTVLNQQQFQQQFQSSSPLIADSPIPSPSSTITAAAIKPPSQPVQMLQQQFTITGHAQAHNQTAGGLQHQQPQQQVYQFIQGPQGQIIAAAQPHNQLAIQQPQQQRTANTATIAVPSTTATNVVTTKSTKQILPKPQQQHENQQQQAHQQLQTKTKINNNHNNNNSLTATSNMPQMPQISQSPQPQQAQLNVTSSTSNTAHQQQQIILPASATTGLAGTPQPQPLLLNQMPVLVQQNTPQGVQLILRPPTPQLTATPSLVIQNTRGQAQLHQQQPQQQLLRIVGTNGATMQLTAATPTFIVSSQANLMQNQIQTAIKSSAQTNPITQLSGLHAALAAQTPRSQPFTTTATINTQLLGQSMAAQLQNLQLAAAAANGNGIAQIQMPSGLSAGAVISQLPAHLQQSLNGATINLNQLNAANLQQIATAFQTPQTAATSTNNNQSATTDIFAQSSSGQVPVAVSSESLRQATSMLHQQQQQQQSQPILAASNAAATIHLQQQQQQQQQAQIQQLQQQLQQTQSQVHQAQQQQQMQQQQQQSIEPKKKARQRKKKTPTMAPSSLAFTSTTTTTTQSQLSNIKVVNTTAVSATSTKSAGVPLQQTHISDANPPPSVPLPPPRAKSASPAPHIQRASNGKLDLGNVMKLCGITEDDDDDEVYEMDTMPNNAATTSVEPIKVDHPANTLTTASTTTSTNNTNDIMISIPNQNGSDGLPFTLTIPAPPPPTTNEATETPNILIKIDQSDASQSGISTVPPYTISIPRLPTAEEIQKQAQQHLAQQAAAAAAAASSAAAAAIKNANVPPSQTISFRLPPLQQQQLLPQHQQPILNVTMAATTAATTTVSTLVSSMPISVPVSATTNTITTSTAAVKPRRKPAVRRNTKKQEIVVSPAAATSTSGGVNTTTTHITATTIQSPIITTASIMMPTQVTSTTTVPSQIGNIQISQVQNNQSLPTTISNTVENKIQIMPIIDNSRLHNNMVSGIAATQLQHQTQNQQMTFQSPISTNSQLSLENTSIKSSSDGRQMNLVSIPQTSSSANFPAAVQPVIAATTHAQALPSQITSTSLPNSATILPPQLTGMPGNVSISVGSPASAAALVPQLTGSLTLAVSEHCERLILRHDPNQPQDQQSQLILQALLKGALPNLTIINEPTKVDTNKQSQPQLQAQVLNVNKTTIAPTAKIDKGNLNRNTIKSTALLPAANAMPQIKIQQQLTKLNESIQGLPQLPQMTIPTTNINSTTVLNPTTTSTSAPVAAGQQRYVALPKIDPSTQQLFCLNTINNQITAISPGQTAASISPTERLLIAPAGINAQQLAQCLQQGQIHFNDVNPLPPTAPMSQQQTNGSVALNVQNQPILTTNQQSRLQPPQQQVVHPVQALSAVNSTVPTITTTSTTTTTTTITKQVANVAPIIDQSKAKLEPSKAATTTATKKKPVRKPKATTTAAEVSSMKNASVVKPMPKLDPLSQKPNNNPVQIVQPNVASGKQIVVVSTSSSSQTTTTTTTTMSNTIQPFQQTSSGTKLVGITAPMQQQPPQLPATNTVNNQQRNNFNIALAENHINTSLACNTVPINNNNVSSNNSSFGHQITVSGPIHCPTSSNQQLQTTTTMTNLPIQSPVVQSTAITSIGQKTQQQQQKQQQPQQHTVSRVQTIQLTPQQQQAFKQVQMQIHYLTIKQQHKLATLPLSLPPDFDTGSIAAFNKPMTDAEINIALQRLFLEQQRILASGKEIPTPEALLPTPNGNGGFTLMTQPQNAITESAKTLSSASIPANVVQPNNHSMTVTAVNMQQQPATQQNVAQRIHIYPMQHHQNVQQNKQKQQQNHQHTPKSNQFQQQQQSTQGTLTNINQHHTKPKLKELPCKSKNTPTHQPQPQFQEQQRESPHPPTLPQPQQKKPLVHNSVASNALQPATSQSNITQQQQSPAQQQYQQQQQLQQPIQNCRTQQAQQSNSINSSNGPPPLLFPNSSHPVIGTSSASNTNSSTTQNNTITTVSQLQIQTQQIHTPPNTSSIAMTSTVVAAASAAKTALPTLSAYIGCAGLPSTVVAALTKAEEIPSPKPKIARLSLFVRQLEVDQESCLKPDYIKPFRTKEEAVKRLIRYHCMHENDEEIQSEEELEFEETALKFQEQFRQLSGKFQQILLQESTLPHRTSELLQMQHLMIDDLKLEMDNLRNKEQENQQRVEHNNQMLLKTNDELKPVKLETDLANTSLDSIHGNQNHQQDEHLSIEDNIVKEEIKVEPCEQRNLKASAVDKFDLLKNSVDLNKSFSKQQQPLEQQEEHDRSQLMEMNDGEKEGKQSWPNSSSNCHQTSLNSITYFNSTFCNKSQFNGAVKKDADSKATEKESKCVKKEYENFDIESELTPSFIMKKVEHKDQATEQEHHRVLQTSETTAAKNVDACLNKYKNATQHQHSKENSVRANPNARVQNPQQKSAMQDDDWYSFQKDLSLISSVDQQQSILMQQQRQHQNNKHNNETLQTQQRPHQQEQQQNHQLKSMDIFNGNNANTVIHEHPLVDLFPNGCIDKSQSHNSSGSSNCTINNSSCSQQRQQPLVLNQEAASRHPAISEFFSTDSDVQKSVETRLEAMFGESPVPLDVKNGNDTEDIESNLDEIFGDSKSSNESNKTKTNMWEQEITGNSFMRTGDNISFDNEPHQTFTNNQQNHIQLSCNANQGWIDNMSHFSDFIGTNTTGNNEPLPIPNGDIRKRPWNEQMISSSSDLDDENSSKRRCTDSSSSSSPLSQPHVNQQHSLIDNDMLSLDDTIAVESTVNNSNANGGGTGFTQMILQQQQQHTFGNHQSFGNMLDSHSNATNLATTQEQHFQHNMHQHPQDLQQMHNSHIPTSGNVVGAGEFDDDISRHVQNAIDSILNLQNSESDSLTFSLGSFLGDSMLEDHRQQPATLPSCQQENSRRRQLVDELGDCLISGGATGTASDNNAGDILLETHHQHHQQQQQHLHHHNPHLANHNTLTLHQNTHQNLNQQHQQHEQRHQNNHHHQQQPLQLHHHHQQTQPPQLNEFNCVSTGIDDAVKSIMTS